MKKKHSSPEFTVIKQDQANAKFFVASFENGTGQTQSHQSGETYPDNVTNSQASSYGSDAGGFNF